MRKRYDGLVATLNSGLSSGSTTINFVEPLTYTGGNVPTLSGDYIPLTILDADGVPAEVVHLTAYSSGGTSGTIGRGEEGSTAGTHLAGVTVLSGPTARDFGVRTSSDTTAPSDPEEGDMWYDPDEPAPTPDPVAAADVTVDDSAFTVLTGTDVQTVLEEIDSALDGLSGGGGLTQVAKFKAADESVSNNTLQDDNHLTFAVAASEVWVIHYHLYVTCAVATADISLKPSVPAGATCRWGIAGVNDTATNTVEAKRQTHPSAALSSGVPATSIIDPYIEFVVTVENGGNAGNVVLQWAQATTDGSNAVTLKRGSWMIATKVA